MIKKIVNIPRSISDLLFVLLILDFLLTQVWSWLVWLFVVVVWLGITGFTWGGFMFYLLWGVLLGGWRDLFLIECISSHLVCLKSKVKSMTENVFSFSKGAH